MIPQLLFSLPLLLAAPANEVPFPLAATGEAGPMGAIELQPLPAQILALREEEAVTMIGAPLADGLVDLELTRISIDLDAQVYVNGEARDGGLDSGDLSVWKGRVKGLETSSVLLGFSLHGCHGWIESGGRRIELLAAPGPGGDWTRSTARLVPAEVISAIGPESGPSCATDTSSLLPLDPEAFAPAGGSGARDSSTLICPIAVETDWQLFQVFGNLPAMQNYVTFLLAAVSDRFFEQVDVILTYPYLAFYTNSNDPWTSQDSGGSCGDVLNEFRNAWAGNIPNDAALGHFISGASLGCGVAWVDVLCNQSYGFSLSCCINGGVSFPVHQGSNTWDFFVIAHELGHNFGSPHTHDFCPPLDLCADNCTGTTQCTNQGTNMSYCHGCPGGMSNITTYFHTEVESLMRERAEQSCLDPWCTATIARYCSTSPNSAGTGALIDSFGTSDITAADFYLAVTECPPSQFIMFYYGGATTSIPFGNGIRCVSGGGVGVFRFKPFKTDFMGTGLMYLDYDAPPANSGLGRIFAGDTWYFQGWYRDPADGGAQYNLTDGLEVTFCP
jgi:hypothetical protein